MSTAIHCEQTGCHGGATVEANPRDKDAVRAAGEAIGWFYMARKGGKCAWRCPRCKPTGAQPTHLASAGADGLKSTSS